MTQVHVTGVLLNPLGAPVPNATIRITAKRVSEELVPEVFATYQTDEQGRYDFNLLYGYFRLEVLVVDEYFLVRDIAINASTPSPTDLSELAQTGTIVTPRPVIPEDPVWATLYAELEKHTATDRRDLTSQIRHDNMYVSDTKSLILNETLEAGMSQETTQIQASDAVTYDKAINAYDNLQQMQAVVDKSEAKTRSSSLKQLTEVYEASNGKQEHYRSHDYVGASQAFLDNVVFDGNKAVTNKKYAFGGNTLQHQDYIDALSNYHSVNATFAGAKTTAQIRDQYGVHDDPANPNYTREHVASFSSGGLTGNVEDSQVIGVTNGELTATTYRGNQVYSRTAFDKLHNTGFVATKTTQADAVIYQGTDGVPLVTMDAVNNTLTVTGRLIVTNPGDFVGPPGESHFQEFEYSVDNANWHTEFQITDIWRRHRSVDNGVRGPWSAGYKLQAEDGAPGDSDWWEYQYAPTREGTWTENMKDGDIWRRQRRWYNGSPTGPWSNPARIRGFDGLEGWVTDREYQYAIKATDPEPKWHSNFTTGDHWRRERVVVYLNHEDLNAGKPHTIGPWINITQIVPIKGIDYGAKQTVLYIFKRSVARPAPPTEVLTYNFDDLTLTPTSGLNGWSFTDMPDGTDPLWVGLATATTQGSTDKIAPGEWSIQQWTSNGQTSALLNLFCKYNAAGFPAVTFDSVTQNLQTGEVTIHGDNRFGWQSTPPENTEKGGKIWYITNVKLVPSAETATHLGNEFAAPTVISVNGVDGAAGINGKDGIDGVAGKTVRTVFKAAATVPDKPIGTAIPPPGWSTSPVIPPEGEIVWISYTFADNPTSTTTSTGWTEAGKFSGEDGANGNMAVFVFRTQAGTPARPTGRQYPPSGWSKTPSASIPKGQMTWACMSVAVNQDADVVLADWSNPGQYSGTPGTDGTNGINGAPGNHGAGSYIWYRGSLSGLTQAELSNFVQSYTGRPSVKGDMVQVCNGSTATATTDSQYWLNQNPAASAPWAVAQFVVNGDAVIDGTLAARKLQAATITGDKISATTTIAAGDVANQKAFLSGAGDWRIWAGNDVAASAPFRVQQDGSLFASNATVTGTVNATSGKFTNVAIGAESSGSTGIFIEGTAIVVRESGNIRVKIGKLV